MPACPPPLSRQHPEQPAPVVVQLAQPRRLANERCRPGPEQRQPAPELGLRALHRALLAAWQCPLAAAPLLPVSVEPAPRPSPPPARPSLRPAVLVRRAAPQSAAHLPPPAPPFARKRLHPFSSPCAPSARLLRSATPPPSGTHPEPVFPRSSSAQSLPHCALRTTEAESSARWS